MAKKKSHGGLKFLAFLAVVGSMIAAVKIGSGTEAGQRVLGHRQDRRVDAHPLIPRFAYASAQVKITSATMYNNDGAAVDLTTTRKVTIDRQSSMSSTDVTRGRTATEIAPGVDAVPFDALTSAWREVLTRDYSYESDDAGQPWLRSPNPPYYYRTSIDEHFIPMIDDIVGFELRDLPPKVAGATTAATAPKSPLQRPAVDGPTTPVSTSATTYEMDLETYRRVVPILAGRTFFDGPPTTEVTLTIGFDDVGLLHHLDVSIPSTVAASSVVALGPRYASLYHYTFEVTEISGEPVNIDVPTNYTVDTADTVPADTVAVPAP